MRASVRILLAGVLLLAGCGQKNDVTVRDKNGSVTVSANGQHFIVRGNDGAHGDVTIAGNGERVVMHAGDGKSAVEINANGVNVSGKMPDFVSLYPGAKVVSSVTGGGAHGGGGTMAFETRAAPADVIGFYKQKTASGGFRQSVDENDNGSLIYAASSGSKTIQVLASKDGNGTHAQVTWSSQ